MNQSIPIRTKQQITVMRSAGKLAADLMDKLERIIKIGKTPLELEKFARKYIQEHRAKPSFLGYEGYPAALCVSINHQLVHGIPTAKPFRAGDVIGIDLGIEVDNWHADFAKTFHLKDSQDKNNSLKERLLATTKKSLEVGLTLIKPGIHFGTVQSAIQKTIEVAGFGVIRDLAGHGIGESVHEPPSFPNFGQPNAGPVFKTGMTLAIEPMASSGSYQIVTAPDHWTVELKDHSIGAHFEHTVVVTQSGCEILTRA